jgi:hypothetical protein
MKAPKSLSLFIFSVLLVSCFQEPEFADEPRIEYKSIYFGRSKNPANPTDSLVIELEFEDGNGDLGLDDRHVNEPYHEQEFFLLDGTTLSQPLREIHYSDVSVPILDIPDNLTGKLARRGDPIPVQTGACDFATDVIFIEHKDFKFFDTTYDTSHVKNPPLVQVLGDFYIKPNPNHNNIEVKFYSTTSTEPENLEEFIWPDCFNFDARFKVLHEGDDERALKGTMRYTMASTGIQANMSTKRWQLRITIKDRMFNTSNEVRTELFTLAQITK